MSGQNSKADPIDVVAAFLVEGNGYADIIEYLQAQQIEPDEIPLIIEQAFSKFIKSARLPPAVRKGWCLEALRELYRRMMASGDYAGALGAVKEIAKLSSIYTTDTAADNKDEIEIYIDEVMSL